MRERPSVEFVCHYCCKTGQKAKHHYNQDIKAGKDYFYCSRECSNKAKITTEELPCLQCQKIFHKRQAEIKKSPNHFCSHSCACTYSNQHKTTGTRRSKLEAYLEEQLRKEFPHLGLQCNSKTIINSKLDFFFPELKFAIELNGIFHYEPIYGADKLEQIQNNDNQKYKQCIKHGIELCIIDSSSVKYLNQAAKDKYWNIVKDLVTSIQKRAGHTNVQVL
jgi:hypothetical protein